MGANMIDRQARANKLGTERIQRYRGRTGREIQERGGRGVGKSIVNEGDSIQMITENGKG